MPGLNYTSIVVPVDLDDLAAARPAIDAAAALAASSGGMVHLVHVRSDIPQSLRDLLPMGDAAAIEACERKLQEVAATVPLAVDRITTRVRVGAVETRVLKEVEARRADLIVVGAHQPETLNFLMGSNAAELTRYAPCSVLVIRKAAAIG